LVRKLIAKADAEGYEEISCYVADDIAANDFWRSCGFLCVGQRDNGNLRKRLHNHWVMRMPTPMQGQLIVEAA
jgi:predicted GNAT superfamily acetyltransferase